MTPATSEIELTLADSVSEFEARKCHARSDERLESFQRAAPSLDAAVVLLDDVVQVLVRTHAHVAPLHMLPPQLPQRAATRHVAIERDRARRGALDFAALTPGRISRYL